MLCGRIGLDGGWFVVFAIPNNLCVWFCFKCTEKFHNKNNQKREGLSSKNSEETGFNYVNFVHLSMEVGRPRASDNHPENRVSE